MEISDLRNISFGSEAFADSAVSKAIDAAVIELVNDTVNKKEMFSEASEIENAEPIQAEVLAKVGESLVINKGSEDGVREKQKGKLERELELESGETLSISLGDIEVSSVDSNNSMIRVNDQKEKPEVGDIVTIEPNNDVFAQDSAPSIDSPGSYVKKVETSDFIIYISGITRKNDNVTFHGKAEAKEEDAQLTVFLPYEYSFFDHKGQEITGKFDLSVSIGNTSKSGSTRSFSGTYAEELVLLNFPKKISWTIGKVPNEATQLARVKLYLETTAVGEVEINLDGVPLMNKY